MKALGSLTYDILFFNLRKEKNDEDDKNSVMNLMKLQCGDKMRLASLLQKC